MAAPAGGVGEDSTEFEDAPLTDAVGATAVAVARCGVALGCEVIVAKSSDGVAAAEAVAQTDTPAVTLVTPPVELPQALPSAVDVKNALCDAESLPPLVVGLRLALPHALCEAAIVDEPVPTASEGEPVAEPVRDPAWLALSRSEDEAREEREDSGALQLGLPLAEPPPMLAEAEKRGLPVPRAWEGVLDVVPKTL